MGRNTQMNLEGWELLLSKEFRDAIIHCGNTSNRASQVRLTELQMREEKYQKGIVEKL